jgi:hypothetical protein
VFDEILLGAERCLPSHFSVFRQSEGDHSGDKGCSHRCATKDGIAAGRIAGGDLIAWSHDIDLATSR